MTKVLERNVAELLVIAVFAMVLLSSCASTANCGPAANAWKTNCPAYR